MEHEIQGPRHAQAATRSFLNITQYLWAERYVSWIVMAMNVSECGCEEVSTSIT
jgi:hypothetical protein